MGMFGIPLKLLLHLLELLQKGSWILQSRFTQVGVLIAFGFYYVLIHILHVVPVLEWLLRFLLMLLWHTLSKILF